MKDHSARERIAVLESKNEELERRIKELEARTQHIAVGELITNFWTVVNELGFSFNEKGVFINTIDNSSSALGRLQVQISALIDSLGLEEVWTEGKLGFRQLQRR